MASQNPEITFDEQSFLLDFINIFKNLSPDYVRQQQFNTVNEAIDKTSSSQNLEGASTESKKAITQYKNFIQLEDKMPYATLNRILAHNPNTLNELTSDQMSALTPHIKIFKEVKSGKKITNIPFPFGNFTSVQDRVDSITKSVFERGVDAGITNISFKDVGDNPVNVGYAFEGSMDLYFQSFHALFVDRETPQGNIQFSDLLDMVRATGGNKRLSQLTEDQISTLNQKKGFKIKLEIGWNVPDDPGRVLGFDIIDGAGGTTLRDRINSQKRTYLIHNIDQELQVDSKDGSVKLSLHFMAAINAVAYSPKADLLYIDPNNEGDEYSMRLADLEDEIAGNEFFQEGLVEEIAGIRSQMAANQISGIRGASPDTLPGAADRALNNRIEQVEVGNISQSQSPQAQLSRILQEKLKELQGLKAQYKVKMSEKKSLAYKRLHNILRSQANGIRYVDLNYGNFYNYEKYVNERAELFSKKQKGEYSSRDQLSKDLQRKAGRVKKLEQKLQKQVDKNIDTETSRKAITSDFITKQLQAKAENSTKRVKQRTSFSTFGYKADDSRRIHYFFLGDLLESIMTIVYKNPKTNQKTGNTNSTKSNKSLYEDIKFLSGTFDYTDPLSGRIVKGMAFADIPVSWSYFNSWFVDHVVKIERQSYSLYTFIQDLCGSLINNLVSPKRYGGIKDFKQLKPTLQAIRVPNESYINKVWTSRKGKFKRRIRTTRVIGQAKANGRLDYRNSEEWFFLGIAGTPISELTKLHAKGSNGKVRSSLVNTYRIPHFIVGAQSGILKDISFKRMQIPFRREWAIAQQSSEVKQNLLFMDKYDATVTLFGSPIYAPGMLIYIDPVGFGLVSTLDKAEWATQIGIGGYYRIVNVSTTISEKDFTTQLSTIAELDFRDIAFANNK